MTTTVTKDDVVSLAAVDNGQAVSNTTKYTGEFEGTFQGTLVGGATTAKQLEKPYNFSLAGDATGTVAVNASSVILNTTVNHATKADTADFAGKTTLSARATLADHSNTAEFAYRCGRLTKLFVTMSGAVVGSGSASDSDTINIDVERVNIADLFVVGKLAEKPDTSRIYADISGRHFWVYNNETGVWVDCYSQLASELDNHGVRISTLEKLNIGGRLTSLEKRTTTAESDIDALEGRATKLEGRATSLEGRASSLESRTTDAEININNHETRITSSESDISKLDARVSNMETSTDVGQYATRLENIDTKNTEQDTAINDNKTAIANNKTAIETALNNEIKNRQNADTEIKNNYVTLATNQSISGFKTFTSGIKVADARLQCSYIDMYHTDGAQVIDWHYNNEAVDYTSRIGENAKGALCATCTSFTVTGTAKASTPASSSNDTSLSTTAWVNTKLASYPTTTTVDNKLKSYVTTNTQQEIYGKKFFKSTSSDATGAYISLWADKEGGNLHICNNNYDVEMDGALLKDTYSDPALRIFMVKDGTVLQNLQLALSGNFRWSGKRMIVGGAEYLPVGSIIMYGGSKAPSGFLLCNGAAISRTTYADLFAQIGVYFGAGDGSTTFNLPTFNKRYPCGAGTIAVGTYLSQALPNISGEVWHYDSWDIANVQASGAFTALSHGHWGSSRDRIDGDGGFSFQASKSNGIYGADGNIVRPYTTVVNFLIKY